MVSLQTIKKTTNEKQLGIIVGRLSPILKYQLITLSKMLEKMNYAVTDHNGNNGQYSDLKNEVDALLLDEFDVDIDEEEE